MIASLLTALLAHAVPATAEPGAVVFTVSTSFRPPHVIVEQGKGLVYAQLDTFAAHSVTSFGWLEPDVVRLFDSGVLNFREFVEVPRVPDLAVGIYPFFCSVHDGMRGTLEII